MDQEWLLHGAAMVRVDHATTILCSLEACGGLIPSFVTIPEMLTVAMVLWAVTLPKL